MPYCYNCGKVFSKKELTKEHIPPRCFSDTYPEEFKKNRITVLCCETCNNEYSKIDSELRDLLAILIDGSDGNQKFLEKGVKSVIQRKQLVEKLYGKGTKILTLFWKIMKCNAWLPIRVLALNALISKKMVKCVLEFEDKPLAGICRKATGEAVAERLMAA